MRILDMKAQSIVIGETYVTSSGNLVRILEHDELEWWRVELVRGDPGLLADARRVAMSRNIVQRMSVEQWDDNVSKEELHRLLYCDGLTDPFAGFAEYLDIEPKYRYRCWYSSTADILENWHKFCSHPFSPEVLEQLHRLRVTG